MPLLIPFLIGASSTGYFWWNSKKADEAPTDLQSNLWGIAKPVLIAVLIILFLRWLYKKGSTDTTKATV